MKIGPKYKIARRLGAPVFEKTQTQKFALLEAQKSRKTKKRPKRLTDYGIRLKEKQKARYSYALSEKVFGRMVREAIRKTGKDSPEILFEALETRLDSVLIRAGLGPTRFFCRQLVSHGHILVNDRRVTIPSYKVKKGDVVQVKPKSLEKGIFNNGNENEKTNNLISWLSVDPVKKMITLKGAPKKEEVDLLFDIDVVLEFYSR